MPDISPRQIGQYLLIAVTTLLGVRAAAFLPLAGSATNPWHLPYAESFDYLPQLEYRQVGGQWEVQDGVLVQKQETASPTLAVIPIDIQPGETYSFQAHLDFHSDSYSGGLLFNLQDVSSQRQSHALRFISDEAQSYLVFGYFDERSSFISQGTIASMNRSFIANGVDLAVVVEETNYDVRLDGGLVASNIPLVYKGGQVALTTWFSQVAFDNISIDLLTPPAAPAGFVATPVPKSEAIAAAFSESFDNPGTQAQWLAFSGDWSFEAGGLLQSNPEGDGFGISYDATYEQFILSVQFSHRQGAGAGVLFNMPQVDSLNGAQVVRYLDENNLIWGYFDEAGAFQEQGRMPVVAPETTSHILEVATNGSTYGIMLDGKPVTVGMSLHSTHGFIGLTTSNTIVEFEQVDLFTGTRQGSATGLG